MIMVTRLNGPSFALNCDLIERVEVTPDSVITMTNGTKHVVQEPVGEIVERIRLFRASVIALSNRLDVTGEAAAPGSTPPLRAVPNPAVED